MTPKSVESRLLRVLVAIALAAVVGVLLILPYRLYSRDIRNATVEAHRVASVLHVALAQALREGEDPSALINRFQGIADLGVHLRPLEPDEVHPASDGRGRSHLDGTDLTYTAPPLLDGRGRQWLAEMHFDLAPVKRESVRLIIDLVLAVVVGSALFSALIFWLVRTSLLGPLRRVTQAIADHDAANEIVVLPPSESRELAELSDAVTRACRAHHAAAH